MKRKILWAVAGLVLLVPLFTYNACQRTTVNFSSAQGTVWGNPLAPVSWQMVFSVCGTLNRCYSQVSYSQCANAILNSSINTQLGAPAGIGTFSSVIQGEETGTVPANQVAADACSSAINTLSCSDPGVQAAYDPNAADPFQNIASMIPTASTPDCAVVFAPAISSWKFVDGNGVSGLNFNPNGGATYVQAATVNSKLYAVWNEVNPSTSASQIRGRVYNGNDTSPAWSFVDGNTAIGLNYDSSKSADFPRAEAFNSKVYVFWTEPNGSGASQIHGRVYNGDDAAPAWPFIDGGGASGLNHSSSQTASWLGSAVFNSKLYLGWQEAVGPIFRVYLKAFDGNDTTPGWTDVTGSAGGFSINAGQETGNPKFAVHNSKLYMSFIEVSPTTGAKQIRVAVFNGNPASPAWLAADGGGTTGLNVNKSQAAQGQSLYVFNSKLYCAWAEVGSLGKNQIRVAVYNGNDSAPVWSFVDGGSSNGLNYNSGDQTDKPMMVSFNSRLYISWSEVSANNVYQIRAAVYNGNDLSPSWSWVDSGTMTGLNHNSIDTGFWANWVLFNSKPYLLWPENNGSAWNVRAVVGQ